MKKAVIFDLDGTLSDSIMSMKYSGDKTMAEFGYGPFSVQDYTCQFISLPPSTWKCRCCTV